MRIPVLALVLAAATFTTPAAHAAPRCFGGHTYGYVCVEVDDPPTGPGSVHVTCGGRYGVVVCDVLDG